MNKFRRLGFIEYNGVLSVHSSLLNVVLTTDGQITPTGGVLPVAGTYFLKVSNID